MTSAIEWSPAALRDFYAVPNWTTAARIDGALQRLATTGEGELRRVDIDGTTARHPLHHVAFDGDLRHLLCAAAVWCLAGAIGDGTHGR